MFVHWFQEFGGLQVVDPSMGDTKVENVFMCSKPEWRGEFPYMRKNMFVQSSVNTHFGVICAAQ